jgi:hypothetical protein
MRTYVNENTPVVPRDKASAPEAAMGEKGLGRRVTADFLTPTYGNNSEVDGK